MRPRFWSAIAACVFMCSGRRERWRGASTRRCGLLGLTNGQFSLLMSLNRPKPAGMGSVASLLALDRTTLTAALKPLERRGLVKITADPDDRRSRLMALTPKGTSLLASAMPIWERTHVEVEASLHDDDPAHFRKNLLALS